MRIQQLFTGVVGVVGVCLFGSLPAKATARLQTWQFDTGQNRFMFTTEGGVQPQVSVSHSPSQLMIDLPGIITDEAMGDQFIGGAVRAVKVMQVDAQTTRIVLDLEPNYTLDPQQVQVWGLTESQWVVQLPSATTAFPTSTTSARSSNQPSAGASTRPSASASAQSKAMGEASVLDNLPQGTVPSQVAPRLSHPSPLPPLLSRNQVSYSPVATTPTVIQGIQATASGFFLPIAGTIPQVQIYRTRDANQARQMVIDILNASIPPHLTPEALPHVRYGVSRWAVTQFPTLPPAVRITLSLDNASPDWQLNRVEGGLVLTPVGTVASQITTAPTTVVLPVIHTNPGQPNPGQPTSPQIHPGVAMATAPTAQLPNRGQVLVMLDPGHGGSDPGAIGIGGLQEKGVVLAVSQHVAATLQSQGIAVQMTRQGDETLSLQARVDRAQTTNATVFVSVHANAISMQRPEVNGLETYYFSDAGFGLASALHRRVIGSIPMNDRGVKQARFFVLRHTTMPSALIEIGFVTGATDAPQLRDPQWQMRMGQAIAQGILDYIHSGGR